MMFGIRMHFVEVGSCFGDVWKAGIGNAGPVLVLFGRDLQEIASSDSVNAVPVLAVCKQFARNGALSNGFQGTLIGGFPGLD